MRPTAMRPIRRLVAALLCAAVGAIAVAAPASAHAVLESTSPVAGGAVDEAPERIELQFSESVEASLGAIRLYNSSGSELDTSPSRHPEGRPAAVVADIPDLGDGTYVVAWRVVSSDAHPINGAFTFEVGDGGPSGEARDLVSELVNSSGSSTVGVLFAAVRWAGFVAVAVVVGGLAFAALMWRGRRLERAHRGIVRGAIAGVVVSLLAIAFQGAYAGGFGLSAVARPSLWWDVATTRFGHAHLARAALFAVALLLVRVPWDRRRTAGWRAGAAVLSVGLALSVAFAGHADTGRWVAVGMTSDVVHVLAFAVWAGGLWALVAWALRGGVDDDDDVAEDDADEVSGAARRFSNVAFVALVAVAVSGTVQGIRQVGSLGALTSTNYGWLLLVKVAIVVVVVGIALVSRSLVRAMAAPSDDDDDDDDDDDHDHDDDEPVATIARRYLRRSVATEVVGVVAVLVVSTLLSSVIPAREAEGLPSDQTVVTDQGFAQFTIDPAKAGSTAIHVVIANTDGTSPDLADLTVTLTLPERDLGPIEVPMSRLTQNHYVNDEATIPFGGTWRITAEARLSEFDQASFTATVEVR